MNPLLLLLAANIPADAPATPAPWGWEAHRVICEIAYRRLSHAGRELVDGLMARDTTLNFAESCLWADAVRGTTHRSTSAYHYVNIPAGSDGFDMQRDCGDPERRCVVWAIPEYAAVLQDEGRPPDERLEALKFLAHFIGDLHQPLHAGRPEDLGGNRVTVEFPDAEGTGIIETNLHQVWDFRMLERSGLSWPVTAAHFDRSIGRAEAAGWESFDVVSWVNESFRAAESIVYDVGDGRITDAYQARGVEYSALAIKRAAVRLAFVLNAIAEGRATFPTM